MVGTGPRSPDLLLWQRSPTPTHSAQNAGGAGPRSPDPPQSWPAPPLSPASTAAASADNALDEDPQPARPATLQLLAPSGGAEPSGLAAPPSPATSAPAVSVSQPSPTSVGRPVPSEHSPSRRSEPSEHDTSASPSSLPAAPPWFAQLPAPAAPPQPAYFNVSIGMESVIRLMENILASPHGSTLQEHMAIVTYLPALRQLYPGTVSTSKVPHRLQSTSKPTQPTRPPTAGPIM